VTVHQFLFMFVVIRQSLKVMVCQVCSSEYKAYNGFLKFSVLYLVSLFFVCYVKKGDVNFKMLVTLLTGIVLMLLCTYIVTIFAEFTSILGIEVFNTKETVLARKQNQKNERPKRTSELPVLGRSYTRFSDELE
jgi:uncharacterized membrane protein